MHKCRNIFSREKEASIMKRFIGDFQIPVGSLTVFFVEAILVTLVIYDHFLIQLWRKWKGKPGKNLISGSPMEARNIVQFCSPWFMWSFSGCVWKNYVISIVCYHFCLATLLSPNHQPLSHNSFTRNSLLVASLLQSWRRWQEVGRGKDELLLRILNWILQYSMCALNFKSSNAWMLEPDQLLKFDYYLWLMTHWDEH